MFISKAVFTKNLLFVLDIITMTAMFIFAAMMLTAEMLMGPLFQINQTNRLAYCSDKKYLKSAFVTAIMNLQRVGVLRKSSCKNATRFFMESRWKMEK